MTLHTIKQDIKNYGISQHFNQSRQLISVVENLNGGFEVTISEGGNSLRTSTVVAKYSDLSSAEIIEKLNLDY